MTITIVFLLLGVGCSRLSYIVHAATGQFRLLHYAVPVEDALKSSSLGPEQKKRLRLVDEIKEFGEGTLGLKKTENYETVNLRSARNPIYIVSACHKDRLAQITWWFPIVGRLPYLGFFDLNTAMEEKEALLKKDLDVIIGRGGAYSTLGWFQDPVTLNLLEGSTVDLVETLLHEMTHVTLYVKGQGEFNEGLAQLVGKMGALLFMTNRYGPAHPFTIEARKALEDERLFSLFLSSLLSDLEALYNSPIRREEKLILRETIFPRYRQRFMEMEGRLQTDHFKGFEKADLNNAYLMSIGLYHRHFHLFEAILKRHGGSIKETLRFFQDLSSKDGDILEKAKEWINAPPVTQPLDYSF